MNFSQLQGRFSEKLWKPDTLRLFRMLVYAWFLVQLAYEWPVHDLLWGRQSMILPLSNTPGLVNNLFFVLNYLRELYWVVLLLHVMSLILGIWGVLGWVPRLIVYLTAGMLYFPAYIAFNGGYVLMWLFSFYLIFTGLKPKEEMGRVLTNFSYMALLTQLMLVYATAAFWKWTGEQWIEGTAMYYVLQTDAYSNPFLKEYLLPQLGLLKLTTWFGLLYQTLFPVMIWFRKTKWVWLVLGLIFHLFIAFGLGLVDFGTAMIVGYILLLDEKTSSTILCQMKLKIREGTQ